MMVKIDGMGGYNPRRWGKPWAANIKFEGAKPNYEFTGHWNGTDLLIEAGPGEVIAFGQKDGRGNGTFKRFAIVQADGSIERTTEAAAWEHSQATVEENPLAGFTIGQLRAELARREQQTTA